ncbi:DUF2862 domain-containing protein [Alkalinema pantanalense CENA528]|uniref:cytochrome b6f subunit PetP n=1 Tax=Alkalinema pantanalense TaxID=1620705 RepID=UPI003D6EEE49
MVCINVAVMEIGQKVRVRRLRDRVPQEVVSKLGKVGTVKDFKVVDGRGLGRLVQFDDQYATWFFEDELEAFN